MRPMTALVIVVLHVFAGPGAADGAAPAEAPVRILDRPALFHGPEGPDFAVAEATALPIGFFGPVDHPSWRGALLAIEEANAAGGYQGVPFQLVTRWDPDPWRGGARAAVQLAVEDQVLAAIGGVDGDSTHIIEQITTKIHFALIGPVSGDPSLTLTAVPWMFRLPPSKDAVAEAVAAALIEDETATPLKIASVHRTDRDGRAWRDALRKALGRRQQAVYVEAVLNSPDAIASTVGRVRGASPDRIILDADADHATAWREAWAADGNPRTPIAWRPGAFEWCVDHPYGETGRRRLRILGIDDDSPEFARFRAAYTARFPGADCDVAAANSYDAAHLLIRAIRETGPNRVRIRNALAAMEVRGAGGRIRWDLGGGNTRPVRTVTEILD